MNELKQSYGFEQQGYYKQMIKSSTEMSHNADAGVWESLGSSPFIHCTRESISYQYGLTGIALQVQGNN